MPVRIPTVLTSRTRMDDSPLGRLPAELSNRVYALVMLSPGPYDINLAKRIEPPLTQVCKEVRNKYRPMFYAMNTFKASVLYTNGSSNSPRVAEWLSKIDPSHGSAIKKIRIDLLFDGGPPSRAERFKLGLLLTRKGLKSSQVQWRFRYFGSGSYSKHQQEQNAWERFLSEQGWQV